MSAVTIDAALMAKVLDQVEIRTGQRGDELVTQLRAAFPGIHFSVCSDDDMPPRLAAAAENALCRLYYVDSADHCLRLSSEAAGATGLVVALLDQDEDS